jgi:hypothetical protein
MTKEMILVMAKREARKQNKILSSSVKWFSPEQVEMVRMPDKTFGWVVGKDCETLRIVMACKYPNQVPLQIHLFDQDETVPLAKEKNAAA